MPDKIINEYNKGNFEYIDLYFALQYFLLFRGLEAMPVEVKNGWFELDDFFGITPLTSSRKSRKLLVKMCGEKNHFFSWERYVI